MLEFQSRPERYMPLRYLSYSSLLYEELIKRDELPAGGELPPILPVVLYNGRRPWRTPRAVSGLRRRLPPGLERHQPELQLLVLDERRWRVDLGADPNLMAAIVALEQGETPQDLAPVVERLLDWLSSPEDRPLRAAFASWLSAVLLPAHGVEGGIPDVEDLEEVRSMLIETVEGWTREWKAEGLRQGREEGLQQGLQEGLQKGIQKGIQKGEARVLSRQLERKFGLLDDEIRRRLARADADQLLRWSERLLDASSLQDVFDGDP